MQDYNDVKVISAAGKIPFESFVEFVKEGKLKYTVKLLSDKIDGDLLIEFSRGVLFFIFPFPVAKIIKNPRVSIADVSLDLKDYSENCLFCNNKESNEVFVSNLIADDNFSFTASSESGVYQEHSFADIIDLIETVIIQAKKTKITVTNPYIIINSRMAPYYDCFAVEGIGVDISKIKNKRILNNMVILEGNFAEYKDALKLLTETKPYCLFELVND